MNFGFWIGSLWGDDFGQGRLNIPEVAFSLVWAVGLIGLGVWAVQRNRRWVLNVVAVFAAIHLYTQWFEHLGAEPLSFLFGGLVALIIALVVRHLNVMLQDRQETLQA